MVNLLNQALRSRDVRKLVEPHLHEVVWDSGVDETSEWVMASFEDLTHIQKLESWLNSKEISDSIEVILTDTAWSELQQTTWDALLKKPDDYFNQKHMLVVAADRSWIMEYTPQQIIRFGRWVKVTCRV
ncbi:hypothetical protein ACNSN2_07235 [Pseudoalteromonas sp. US3C1013]|uniref:hypothetical protein n=1 Tax=unclassified Pseudoalteromonas TaxID=194690 RepID=UPI000D6FEC2C|nr:hypothetical protein [Pseudoalteromonas sp. meg-B1]PWS56341.1 hypothetical protein DK924_06275 [Pseudoalteromonas sp. meg-B1]|tara:strand:+ start:114 stop:500 length:387 start_codon:yes stop_codon:yes gene_type:complete